MLILNVTAAARSGSQKWAAVQKSARVIQAPYGTPLHILHFAALYYCCPSRACGVLAVFSVGFGSGGVLSVSRFVLFRLALFFCCFFFVFMVSSVSSSSLLPSPLAAALAGARCVVFSGSRSVLPPAAVWAAAVAAVPAAAAVFVGCARGVDLACRVAFPGASVWFASAFGSGRASFARRSVAVVRAAAGSASPVFLSFPGAACPAGVFPSSVSSRCFCGAGSGSWASLAFAVGSGVPSFVFLPAGVAAPAGWGLVPLGGGWFAAGVSGTGVQLSFGL